MKEILLLKCGEIALKGLNRSSFENQLMKNIRRRLSPLGKFEVQKSQSTITVEPKEDGIDMDEALDRVSRVFGAVAISRSAVLEKSFEALKEGVPFLDAELMAAHTFKVEAKRSDKSFPMASPEICRELGGYILGRYPHLKVDVHQPDVTVIAEIRDRNAFLHAGQLPGAGGIPIGAGGKAALLISGGIDSPVAGYMMAKRGMEVTGVHFASPPYTSERAKLKVMELCRLVSRYSGRMRLDIVNFTKIQDEIGRCCPEEYFTIIMRRFMMEIASRIGEKIGCAALITGESVGQVASQTVYAIACTDAASSLPVFRPVIGMDKEEIVKISRRIGTFETSILPYEDCCTVFTPRHPKTRPQLAQVIQAEQSLDREALILEALSSVETVYIDEQSEF